jgi:hypothetical protein
LPKDLYLKFDELLTILSDATSTCSQSTNGNCVLNSGDCSYYETLIGTEFTFKVKFTDSDNYMRIPLFSLSEDTTDSEGNPTCNLFVRYLSTGSDVILGA